MVIFGIVRTFGIRFHRNDLGHGQMAIDPHPPSTFRLVVEEGFQQPDMNPLRRVIHELDALVDKHKYDSSKVNQELIQFYWSVKDSVKDDVELFQRIVRFWTNHWRR
jgi:hypothetical protein